MLILHSEAFLRDADLQDTRQIPYIIQNIQIAQGKYDESGLMFCLVSRSVLNMPLMNPSTVRYTHVPFLLPQAYATNVLAVALSYLQVGGSTPTVL